MKRRILQLFFASLLIAPSLLGQQQATGTLPQDRIEITATHKQALEQRLNNFTQAHLTRLNPEELQYITNLIYLAYALSSLDSHVRSQAQEILFCAKAIQANMLNYEQTGKIRKYLVKMLGTIDDATTAQITHLKTWQHCCAVEDTLDQAGNLFKAMEAFKDVLTFEIGYWATENKDAFDQLLEQSSKIFIETGESLTMHGNAYRNLQRDATPLACATEDTYVAKISLASDNAKKADEQCWQSIDAALQITATQNMLQLLNIEIVSLYYQAAYKQLALHAPQYRTFMYNEQGLIPAEQRTQELPAA
jgi:hypothetical protein